MMPIARTANRLLLRTLETIAPAEVCEQMIGDLFEQARKDPRPLSRLAAGTARSILPLLLFRLGQALRALRWADLGALIAAWAALDVWEHEVARGGAWEVAKRILDLSPLSAALTCMGSYVFLYGVLALAVSGLSMVLKRRGWLSAWSSFLVHAALFAVPVSLLVQPTSLDGPGFRLAQLAAITAAVVFVRLCAPRRDGPGPTPSC